MELAELARCPECGAEGKIRVTIGGPNFYYAVHCTKCNCSSRGTGNILPLLYSSDSSDVPQATMEAACEAWNKMSDKGLQPEDEDWQCPNCGEFWGIEEFDSQRCGSCGYPDYDEDDD